MRHIKIIVLYVYFSSNLQLPIFGVARFSLHFTCCTGDIQYKVCGTEYYYVITIINYMYSCVSWINPDG